MTFNLVLIAAAVALAPASAPALAKSAQTVRYDQWEQKLRARVNALHVYPNEAGLGAMGDVLVAFRIGSDGKPADIAIRRSSGHEEFDSAAVRLVSRIGRLGPIPVDGNAREVQLKLSYGDASANLAKADRQERFANERRNRQIVSSVTRVAERR